jgi:hypothetical protein
MAGIDELDLPVKFLGDPLRLFFRFGSTFEVTPTAGCADRIKCENQKSFIGVRMHEF